MQLRRDREHLTPDEAEKRLARRATRTDTVTAIGRPAYSAVGRHARHRTDSVALGSGRTQRSATASRAAQETGRPQAIRCAVLAGRVTFGTFDAC